MTVCRCVLYHAQLAIRDLSTLDHPCQLRSLSLQIWSMDSLDGLPSDPRVNFPQLEQLTLVTLIDSKNEATNSADFVEFLHKREHVQQIIVRMQSNLYIEAYSSSFQGSEYEHMWEALRAAVTQVKNCVFRAELRVKADWVTEKVVRIVSDCFRNPIHTLGFFCRTGWHRSHVDKSWLLREGLVHTNALIGGSQSVIEEILKKAFPNALVQKSTRISISTRWYIDHEPRLQSAPKQ